MAAQYAELKGAVKGQVVTRFPPEASGYLHIGHAKAALLNYHYKQIYEGKLILRFDDTNPEKENSEFEEVIKKDVENLGIKYDVMSFTSDHFDTLLEKCRQMLEQGLAYVDDTPAEQMKIEREKRLESRCRSQTVEESIAKWEEMLKGTESGRKSCVRAKIDFASKNGCLRDPTMYRFKDEPHPRFGHKYKVYPTYDFACPLVDSIEGVTHALRTSEYVDRDPQYHWFLESLKMRQPTISSYSRLNMMNTILSKRKLTWLVEKKLVDGWDDPRMPTVQGILRRGLTVEGLKEFILAQGSSKAIVFMEWDKIWAFNKKVIEPKVPRYTAVVKDGIVIVNLTNVREPIPIDIAYHPKDESLGVRKVLVSSKLIVEKEDAMLLKEDESATLLGLGNIKICKIHLDENKTIINIDASLNLEDKNFKKTPKLTWLNAEDNKEVELIYYDHIITKSVLGKDEEFTNFINPNTKFTISALTDSELSSKMNKGEIVQYQRKGNFIIDQNDSGKLVLIYIPDGTSKNPYTTVVASSGKKPKEATQVKKPKEATQVKKPDEPKVKEGNSKETSKKPSKKDAKQNPQKLENKNQVPCKDKQHTDGKKQTKLGISAKKEDDFSSWYTETITRGEMIEYYDVSGCYIFRPGSYFIWETIQSFFDKKIKQIGVENCYFPMFVSKQALETEKDHIADFAPEVAWVTKSGKSDLVEPIAIRPTSETVMYPAFAKWTQSHRDLPIKLNQWNNVVRWEFKDPTPFIRTREFLWQEGHTAFAEKNEALEEVDCILEFYAQVYEQVLAVPVVRGRKSEKEKFPGADFTLTIEGYIGNSGRGIQCATSHHLGQNFSKMFDISFQDPSDSTKRCHAYQNSWGLSTRTIGVLIMTHGDNKGLVFPPKVAPTQVIVIPVGITAKTPPEDVELLYDSCKKLNKILIDGDIRSKVDLSQHNTPGWKFNYYELKGVCIRVELGPKDLKKSCIVACRRDTGEKTEIEFSFDNSPLFLNNMQNVLNDIQKTLYEKAKHDLDTHQFKTKDWTSFMAKLDEKCTLISPFCGRPECEDKIKKDSAKESTEGALMGAKSLCIPKTQPVESFTRCIHPECSSESKYWCLFGRSY